MTELLVTQPVGNQAMAARCPCGEVVELVYHGRECTCGRTVDVEVEFRD